MIAGEKYRIRLKILFYYLSIQNDELKKLSQIKNTHTWVLIKMRIPDTQLQI